MYTEPTVTDLEYTLEQSGLLYDYAADKTVRDEDIPFYRWLQAHYLADCLKTLEKKLREEEDAALKYCLKNPSDNFTIRTEPLSRCVDIGKLIECRRDIFESYRIPKNTFINSLCTPYEWCEHMKKHFGVTEEDLCDPANVKVNVRDVERVLGRKCAQTVIVPASFAYVIKEKTE